MKFKNIEIIAYAQGWLEGRLEEDVAAVEDEVEKRHRQEMLQAFLVVSNGFDELRKENVALSAQVAQVLKVFDK